MSTAGTSTVAAAHLAGLETILIRTKLCATPRFLLAGITVVPNRHHLANIEGGMVHGSWDVQGLWSPVWTQTDNNRLTGGGAVCTGSALASMTLGTTSSKGNAVPRQGPVCSHRSHLVGLQQAAWGTHLESNPRMFALG